MAITVFPAPSSGGGAAMTQKIDIITATASWVAPVGVTRVEIILCGGGGGGGGAQAGVQTPGTAGAGSVFYNMLTVSPGTSYTVTIGGGGAGGNDMANGTTGTSSSFGALMTATGGTGGRYGDGAAVFGSVPAGLGGSGSPGTSNSTNQPSSAPGSPGAHGYGGGGSGGASMNSRVGGTSNGAGRGGLFDTDGVAALANTGAGGGGAGGGNVARRGGNGSSGIAIIKYWS